MFSQNSMECNGNKYGENNGVATPVLQSYFVTELTTFYGWYCKVPTYRVYLLKHYDMINFISQNSSYRFLVTKNIG